MIFLIEYDRPKGQIIQFNSFENSKKHEAEQLRRNIELQLNRSAISHEVVLLDAASKKDLRRTHRRYFENKDQIGKPFNFKAA